MQKFVNVDAGDECDCENTLDECDCEARDELPELIALCEKYGEEVAERAVEAGYDAAEAKTAEFVRESEEANAESED